MLSHPGTKAGLSHCGFGGTLEFINAGVPLLCLPHFGDQAMNAELIVERQIGELLIPISKARNKYEENLTYKNPVFTQLDIKDKFSKLLTDECYQLKAKQVQIQCRSTGGRKLACDTVETIYFGGSEHLIDFDYHKKMKKISCCNNLLLFTIIASFLVAFTWLLEQQLKR